MSIDDVAKRRTPAVTLTPVTAIITAVTEAGVLATPIGGTTDHPVGPCRGPRTTNTGTALAAGMHVLLVFTTTGPWIVAVDE